MTPGARLEGLIFLGMTWRSNTSYSAFKKFLGLIGLVAFLYPRTYVDYGAQIAYTDASTPKWKPWVYPGTRLVGLLYVIIALESREMNRKRKCLPFYLVAVQLETREISETQL